MCASGRNAERARNDAACFGTVVRVCCWVSLRGDVLNVLFLVLDLGVPFIMLVVASVIKRFPPRFGELMGYHTSIAKMNELTWNTAQWLYVRYCFILMIPATIIGAAGGIIGIVINFDEDTGALVCAGINIAQAILHVAAIILTEAGLHKRFDSNGNLK